MMNGAVNDNQLLFQQHFFWLEVITLAGKTTPLEIKKTKRPQLPLRGDNCSEHEHQAYNYAVESTEMDLKNVLQYSKQQNQNIN